MVGGLIQLQQRLQEAENLIQKLEDQLQTLIDEENIPANTNESKPTVHGGLTIEATEQMEPVQSHVYNSYGARYADTASYGAYGETKTADVAVQTSMIGEARDASFCIGREGAFSSYRRPV